jgi:hypothetical protein
VTEPKPKQVAAVVTEYRRHSHADVIVGKIIEGFHHDGKDRPRMRLASLYVDQFPKADMSRQLAKKYKFPIYDTIEGALTLGRKQLSVDGVVCIGEHGNYPANKRGQVLYPRRRFFEAVANVFAKYNRSVPVFNDKHLAATWEDARWMYDRARALFVPFMAGSSVPVTWRRPPLSLPRNSELVEAVQIGYGPLEAYGFHALEGLQCLAERRRGGETGVRSAQWVEREGMWRAMDKGLWSRPLLEAAMARVPAHAKGDYRKLTAGTAEAGVFLIDYRDGFKGAVAMMNGWVRDGGGDGFTCAVRVRGRDKPLSTQFYTQQPDPFGHFIYLVKAIDAMVQTGHAVYPVERTLLTTGILDAIMTSHAEKGRKIDTPHLAIRYQPTDWPFATDPVPKPVKR